MGSAFLLRSMVSGGRDLSRSASRDQMNHNRNYGEDEEDVNQETGYMEEEETTSPQKDQDKS
jgi:hypothetical protein